MNPVSSIDEDEKLKLTLYSAVSKTCDDVGSNNTLIGQFDCNVDAKAVITELIWKKIGQYAEDLESFAQHAKRNQINMDDLKLLFRRNTKILEEMNKLEAGEADKPTEKGKKRKQSTLELEDDGN